MIDMRELSDIVARFLAMSARILPDDVDKKLSELKAAERLPLAQYVYDSMSKNQELAASLVRPSCQDTGVINYFVSAGERFPRLGEIAGMLREATRIATLRAPLRRNTVAIFDEKNDDTNLGERAPFIHWDIVPDNDQLKIESYMAGGGCSLPGRAMTFMPSAGYEAIVKYVLDTAVDWGINACPPLLVGVGIAGSVENASLLSKKALLRPIGSRNANPLAADLEQRLEEGLNRIGIGPQGLGGSSSVLGVHIETAARHPSTISAGVNFGCWSHRRGAIVFEKDLSYKLISHRGVQL